MLLFAVDIIAIATAIVISAPAPKGSEQPSLRIQFLLYVSRVSLLFVLLMQCLLLIIRIR